MTAPSVLVVHEGSGVGDAVGGIVEAGCDVATAEGVDAALEWLDREAFDCVAGVQLGTGPEDARGGSAGETGETGETGEAVDRSGDDGLALLRATRRADADLPVVLWGPDDEAAVEARRLGAQCIDPSAPDAAEEFVTAVTRAVEGAHLVTDGAARGSSPAVDVSGHRPSAAQIARAVDEAPVGITMADPSLPDLPLVYVNEAYERLTGYDAEEAIGRNCRFLQGPESDPQAVARMRRAIEDEEPVSVELVNYRNDGTPFWNRVTLAPIENESGEVIHYVGFQEDISARKEAVERARQRAAALHEERRALDRVLDRLDGLLNEVTSELVDAGDRRELLAGVRDRVAAAEGYRGAWIAEVNRRGGVAVGEVVVGQGPAEAGTEIPLDEGEGPVARAYRTGEVVTATDEPAGPAALDPAGFDAIGLAAVPLAYRGTTYGVLGVYADRFEVADDREAAVLGALGRMIGAGLNAVRTRRALRTDAVLELGFEIDDPSLPIVGLAEAVGGEVRYERSEVDGDGRRLHVTIADPPADLASILADTPGVEAVAAVVERDDEAVVSLSMAALPLIEELSAHGHTVHRLDATATGVQLEVTTALETDVRTLLELLRGTCESVEFVSQRERAEHGHEPGEFVAAVREALTDRQHAALETAYLGGYFEWPRPADGDELAASMGISRQTFHQHLRAAQRKLLAAFFN